MRTGVAIRTGRRALATAAGFVLAGILLSGCGAVWTYNGAMRLQDRYHPHPFTPPDSVALALPQPPPVYAVVFEEGFYVPPPPVVLRRRPSPSGPGDSTRVELVLPDSLGADTTLVGPVLDLAIPKVRVDLPPDQESALAAQARRDMAQADSLLNALPESGRAGGTPREQVEAARGLLNQAEAALDRKDVQGAANLARKARILAESLAASTP